MDTILNGHNSKWHNFEWTPSRMGTILNEHDPEWTPFVSFFALETTPFLGADLYCGKNKVNL